MASLVTGAAGFVGRHLVRRLADAVPLTREDADLTRSLPALPAADSIIHCAAEIDDASMMRAVNVDGTRRLVELALTSGVRTFIYVSTGGVTGQYAETKRQGESIVLGASAEMNVSVLRLFFPYGEGQGQRRLVPRLIANVRTGTPVVIDSEGGPRLSFTYIDDVVEGILRTLALKGTHVADLGGPPASLKDVVATIARLIGQEPVFKIGPRRADSLIADTTVLRNAAGFLATTPIEEGLRHCV